MTTGIEPIVDVGPSNESAMPPRYTAGELASIGGLLLAGAVYAGASYLLHKGVDVATTLPSKLAKRARILSDDLVRDGLIEQPDIVATPQTVRKIGFLDYIGVER